MADKVLIVMPAYTTALVTLWVAMDKGFFQEEGLEVETEYILGQHLGKIPAREGKVVFHAPGSSAPFRAAREGREEINVVSLGDRPAHVLVTRPEITAVEQLRGKRVSVAFEGASYIDARQALIHFGLDPDRDVELVSSDETPPDTERARLEALRQGRVDAVCCDPPHWNMAVNWGFRRLPSARDFICWPECGLTATRKVIQEHPDVVKKVVRGAIRGAEFTRLNKEETLDVTLRHTPFINRALASDCYDAVHNDYGPFTDVPAHHKKIEVYSQEWKLPPKSFDCYYDLRFVREAVEELGLLRAWSQA